MLYVVVYVLYCLCALVTSLVLIGKPDPSLLCFDISAFEYELQTMSAESGPGIVQSCPFTHVAHRGLSMSDVFSLTENTQLVGKTGQEE